MNAPRTKEDVVRAAGRLFAERGFHGTSMRDLGRELGLFGSSLYSHVDGKNELLIEVIRSGARLFQGLADEVAASQGGAADRLHTLVTGHVSIIADHIDEATTFLNEARFLPAEDRTEVVAMRNRYESVYRELLEEGITRGEFRSDLDPALHAILILSVLNALERWFRPDGGRTPDEIGAVLYTFIMEGIT